METSSVVEVKMTQEEEGSVFPTCKPVQLCYAAPGIEDDRPFIRVEECTDRIAGG